MGSGRMWLNSPTLFVFLSFTVGALNFVDSLFRYMAGAQYPLGMYLKPVFFVVQTVSLIMFIRSVRSIKKPIDPYTRFSRFFSAYIILTVVVFLLYLDFQIFQFAGITTANAFLQLLLDVTYVVALSGTCFWFASRLLNLDTWRWLSAVFVLVGLAFATAFLEPMFFWSQNFAGLVFPGQLALIGMYAPLITMFIAAMLTLVIVFRKTLIKNSPPSSTLSRLILLLVVPAFLLPLLWDGYKDGLINFVIRDVFYVGLGYSGFQWYSVSFYFMAFAAYIFTLKKLSTFSDQKLASLLILWGVASFPWNGIFFLKGGYSSISGNMVSLGSIITGASLLASRRGLG